MSQTDKIARGHSPEGIRKWPRRGKHWDVFNDNEIQRIDEVELPYWPVGEYFVTDDDANAFVLMAATRQNPNVPMTVVMECRRAVLALTRGWGRDTRELDDAMELPSGGRWKP